LGAEYTINAASQNAVAEIKALGGADAAEVLAESTVSPRLVFTF